MASSRPGHENNSNFLGYNFLKYIINPRNQPNQTDPTKCFYFYNSNHQESHTFFFLIKKAISKPILKSIEEDLIFVYVCPVYDDILYAKPITALLMFPLSRINSPAFLFDMFKIVGPISFLGQSQCTKSHNRIQVPLYQLRVSLKDTEVKVGPINFRWREYNFLGFITFILHLMFQHYCKGTTKKLASLYDSMYLTALDGSQSAGGALVAWCLDDRLFIYLFL